MIEIYETKDKILTDGKKYNEKQQTTKCESKNAQRRKVNQRKA